jgi:hypothetical protein
MGLEHGFDGIGNDFPAGERVFHAVVSHRNTIANTNGVEHKGHSSGFADTLFDELSDIVQMNMSRYDVHMGTDNSNEGFTKVFFVNSASAEQSSVRRTSIALFDSI